MKAAIFTPYLDTLGGGERYMLSAAKVIADAGYTTYLQTNNPQMLKKAEERFNLDLQNIKTVEDINRGDGYDLCLWLSDGSIPALRARKTYFIFKDHFIKSKEKVY